MLADLDKADLNNANLRNTDLSGAVVLNTNLSGGFLNDGPVSQSQLDQACGTDVKLHPGFTINPCQK